ncbi:MAG TPA: hypothetical protein VFI31_13030, partial [Pirellulales bacterium]|nr:hypothetical protein [Pirellulales bacterium]
MLAEEYIKRAEQARGISSQVPLQKRCVSERGLDFGFYNGGGLDDGRKRLLVAAQVVSNPAELLGRFSELLLAKCRVKYFFVDVDAVPDALARI